MTGSKMLFAQLTDGSRRKVEVWYTLSVELTATDQDGFPLEDSWQFAEAESALDALRLLREDEYRYAVVDRYVRVWDASPGGDWQKPFVQHAGELKSVTQDHDAIDHFDILAVRAPTPLSPSSIWTVPDAGGYSSRVELDPCRGDCRKDESGRCPFDPVCNN